MGKLIMRHNTTACTVTTHEPKFYIYGGVAGLQKGSVMKVTTSDVNYKEDIASKEDRKERQAPADITGYNAREGAVSQIGKRDIKNSVESEKGDMVNFDYYRERKATLKEKLEDALQRNRESIARQDQNSTESTRKEYLEFSKQIMELGDELKRRNKGILPDWWQE